MTYGSHDEKYYFDAKTDLATVFVKRCLSFCTPGGSAALVTPQNWLFLTSYKNLRKRLLQNQTWNMVTRLGPGAFETISGEVVNVTLLLLTRSLMGKDQKIHGIEASTPRTAAEKADLLCVGEVQSVLQAGQLKNPDNRVTLEDLVHVDLLSNYAVCLAGVLNGDSPKFQHFFGN